MGHLVSIAHEVPLDEGSTLFTESDTPAVLAVLAGRISLESAAGEPPVTIEAGDVVGVFETLAGAGQRTTRRRRQRGPLAAHRTRGAVRAAGATARAAAAAVRRVVPGTVRDGWSSRRWRGRGVTSRRSYADNCSCARQKRVDSQTAFSNSKFGGSTNNHWDACMKWQTIWVRVPGDVAIVDLGGTMGSPAMTSCRQWSGSCSIRWPTPRAAHTPIHPGSGTDFTASDRILPRSHGSSKARARNVSPPYKSWPPAHCGSATTTQLGFPKMSIARSSRLHGSRRAGLTR